MKKKILFAVQLPPPVHGASVMNQLAVESELIRSTFDCRLLSLQFTASISEIGTINVKKFWRMVVVCWRLFVIMLRWKPDAVYLCLSPLGPAFYRDAIFVAIVRLFGKKIVYHLHGKGIRSQANSSAIKKRIGRFIFRNASVIVLAESLKQDIKDVYNGEPYVVPNALPQMPHRPRNDRPAFPVFIYLSNLVRTKGIGDFLEALKNLHDKNVPFNAVIVGASGDVTMEEVKQYVQENQLTDKIEIKGPLYGPEKLEVLEKSDIFVFPTFYENEGFPVSILEAMRAGLPVIAADNGAIAEIVTDGITGFVVPPRDTGILTEKMGILARDKKWSMRMGLEGRARFEQLYTIDVFEQKLCETFHQILNN